MIKMIQVKIPEILDDRFIEIKKDVDELKLSLAYLSEKVNNLLSDLKI